MSDVKLFGQFKTKCPFVAHDNSLWFYYRFFLLIIMLNVVVMILDD